VIPRCAALAAGLLCLDAAGACTSPRPSTCEGQRIGTFGFRAVAGSGDAGCPFASDAGVDFTATVAFGDGTSALLCIDRPEAEPLRGTHGGDHLVVSSPDAGANVPSCACSVLVTESVVGDLVRGDGGSPTGFTGELRNVLEPAVAGASCEPDGGEPDAGPSCGVPCELRWQLTGS
jgi:hypothetical protein